MRDIANRRGLTPLFENGISPAPEAGTGAGVLEAGSSQAFEGGLRRLDALKRLFDGISGLGWSVLGFVGGAVFWHFVGFWGFLSEVVLDGGPIGIMERAAIEAPALPQAQPRQRRVQVADASAPACTLLSLDRKTGLTSARPCDADHPPLPADVSQGREDRVMTTSGADRSAGSDIGPISDP